MQHDASRGDAQKPFLTASWHDLVMITWEVQRSVLRPLLAPGTELDLWEGEPLMSLVAFDFRDTRVLGMRVPFHTRFPEVNLRFYVRRQLPDRSWQRGVTFVQEMVSRRAVAWVARTFYGEPYVARAMRRVAVPEQPLASDSIGSIGSSRSLVYEWHRDGEWERVIALVTEAPRAIARESLESFIVEQEWGYTRRPGKPSMEYRVQHPPWKVSMAADCLIEADLRAMYGTRFAECFTSSPISTLVADGSAVIVGRGTPVPA